MLRKVLETYSSFRVPNTAMNLEQRMEALFDDEITRLKIYKFANHLSHADGLGFATAFPDGPECKEAIDLFLAELKRRDPIHHDGMVALVV